MTVPLTYTKLARAGRCSREQVLQRSGSEPSSSLYFPTGHSYNTAHRYRCSKSKIEAKLIPTVSIM